MNSLRSIAQDMRDFKDLFTGKPLKPRSEERKSVAASDDMGGTEAGMEMFAKESLHAESEPARKPEPKTEPKVETESASSGAAHSKADTKPILDAEMRAELMAELREELKEEMRAELRASNAAAASAVSAGELAPSPAATAPSTD